MNMNMSWFTDWTAKGCWLALAGLLAISASADEQVLWWQIQDPSEIDTVGNWGVHKTADELGVTHARMRVDGGGSEPVYLGIATLPVYDEGTGQVIDQTFDPPISQFGLPGEYLFELGSYGNVAYSFVVELGNFENGEWVKIAESATASYDYLVAQNHIYSYDDFNPGIVSPWVADSYGVPEPSSGILLLIGGALLALRRRSGSGGR